MNAIFIANRYNNAYKYLTKYRMDGEKHDR